MRNLTLATRVSGEDEKQQIFWCREDGLGCGVLKSTPILEVRFFPVVDARRSYPYRYCRLTSLLTSLILSSVRSLRHDA